MPFLSGNFSKDRPIIATHIVNSATKANMRNPIVPRLVNALVQGDIMVAPLRIMELLKASTLLATSASELHSAFRALSTSSAVSSSASTSVDSESQLVKVAKEIMDLDSKLRRMKSGAAKDVVVATLDTLAAKHASLLAQIQASRPRSESSPPREHEDASLASITSEPLSRE
jgi:hypothetical protein